MLKSTYKSPNIWVFLLLGLLVGILCESVCGQTNGTAVNPKMYYYYNSALQKIDSVSGNLVITASDGISTVYNDIKVFADTNLHRLDLWLQKASDKLGVAAEKVWDVLVRQQRVWAAQYTFAGLCFFYLLFSILRTIRKNEEISDNDTAVLTIQGVLVVIIGFIFFFNMEDIWTGWINPEYGAMKQLYRIATERNWMY